MKIDDVEITGWKMTDFNLSNIQDPKFENKLVTKVPTFYRAYFEVDEVGDTFLNPTGWTHGTVLILDVTRLSDHSSPSTFQSTF